MKMFGRHYHHLGTGGRKKESLKAGQKAGELSFSKKKNRPHEQAFGRLKTSMRISFSSATVAALLLAFLVSAVFVTGCSSSTPDGTVLDFIRARVAGREERAAQLTLEGDLSGYLGGENHMADSEMSLSAEVSELVGDRALVMVRFRLPEEELEIPYVCRREGARWKVSLRETEELWYPEVREPEGGQKEGFL